MSRPPKKKKPLHQLLRSSMRDTWLKYYRYDCIKKNRIKPGVYQCDSCAKLGKESDFQVDHIVPVGPTPGSRNASDDASWDDWISRLFCDVDGLQMLCKPCHDQKTKGEKSKNKKK